jgi:hypothetical protein
LCAIVAVGALAFLTAPVRASSAEIILSDGEQPTWPAFSDVLNDPCPPPPPPPTYAPPGWIPQNVLTSSAVGTAPLPPAVMTGLLMLGGNWVMTRMWKKRRL